ncbi:hypothetical protein [Solidesulfovibrio sp.]
MRRYDEFEFCLDGYVFAVKLREVKRWRLVLRIVVNTCGLLAVLAGCLLLWSGCKDSASFAAVAGLGFFVLGKE